MMARSQAAAIVDAFPRQRLLVVGDLMLDRYVRGTVQRISPEAPVPVVQVTGETASAGGAANVAVNIRALGGAVAVAGVVGSDRAGDELLGILRGLGIDTDAVLRCDAVPTPVKTRIVAERQQVVRVDREGSGPLPPALVDALCNALPAQAARARAVVIEDYGKGVVSQATAGAALRAAQAAGALTGYDPKEGHELQLSGLTLATPNYAEACWAAGLKPSPLGPDPLANATLARTGETLMSKWSLDFLMITLGPHGMYLVHRDRPPEVIPTRAREVFDVSGAGDTVIAAAMLSLAAGAGHSAAAQLANWAAGVVVGKLGTATCSPAELLASIPEGGAP